VKSLQKNGVLIYDSDKVADVPAFSGTVIGIPFARIAKEEIGKAQTANVLTLGAVVAITGIVSVQSIQRAVLEEVPAGTQELNSRALARGLAIDQTDWQAHRK
jgi:2-oxoglutarate ferredoxin oxidoreductase subunit gamma